MDDEVVVEVDVDDCSDGGNGGIVGSGEGIVEGGIADDGGVNDGGADDGTEGSEGADGSEGGEIFTVVEYGTSKLNEPTVK